MSFLLKNSKTFVKFSFRNFHSVDPQKIRNLAVIAHVDHGKTTLVDKIIKQTLQNFNENESTKASMDCNELEKEKGITILSKVTRLNYKGHVFNIVDTPGHSDFGGEVERVMSAIDNVVLVVDYKEGPQTQTKFVLQKALRQPNIRPFVFVNKLDGRDHIAATLTNLETQVFDLFVNLGADDLQLDYTTLYGSAKLGNMFKDLENMEDRQPVTLLLDELIEKGNPPMVNSFGQTNFKMIPTSLESMPGGYGLTGRVHSGTVKKGDKIFLIKKDDKTVLSTKVKDLWVTLGYERDNKIEALSEGDIGIVQLDKNVVPELKHTLTDKKTDTPLESVQIDPPTIVVRVTPNSSPLAGKDGKLLLMDVIGKRLAKEAANNVGIECVESPSKDFWDIKARGELQLGILIEQMRREGFELSLSSPSIIDKEIDGVKCEPYLKIYLTCPNEFLGRVTEIITERRGEISNLVQGKIDMSFECVISSRNFLGVSSLLREITSANFSLQTEIFDFQPVSDFSVPSMRRKVMVSLTNGQVNAHDMRKLSSQGVLFVKERETVYEGQIVGELFSSVQELEVNLCKTALMLQDDGRDAVKSVKTFNIEQALSFIEQDELVEVTPKRISMRKKIIDAAERKKANRKRQNYL